MGSRPCLHSHAILGVSKVAVLDTNANHRFFIGLLSQTSHAVPWPGPRVTLCILICSLPSPIETQSSPVSMVE